MNPENLLTTFVYRRLLIETTTALHAGSGEHDPLQDMPIQVDVNGFPVINATSITGVLRHLYPCGHEVQELFGDLDRGGSRLVVSDALPLDGHGKPIEGLHPELKNADSKYLQYLRKLFLRDHCAIDHRGTALKNAKFDRSILCAGVRFMLELRVGATQGQQHVAEQQADMLVSLFAHPEFRLGGGTRNGFGAIKLIKVTGRTYDLLQSADKADFLKRSSSLACQNDEPEQQLPVVAETTRHRTLTLQPELFWLTAAGSGDGRLDVVPKTEPRVDWSSGKPSIQSKVVLLPATSIKGALRHRTAYHYNKAKRIFADQLTPEQLDEVTKHNPAVESLFGFANDQELQGRRGRVILSDIYFDNPSEKVLNHVAIDRFTGGAYEGALFTEKVIQGGTFKLDVVIMPSTDDHDEALAAFDKALDDLANGNLPLGGGVNRGHGAMTAC